MLSADGHHESRIAIAEAVDLLATVVTAKSQWSDMTNQVKHQSPPARILTYLFQKEESCCLFVQLAVAARVLELAQRREDSAKGLEVFAEDWANQLVELLTDKRSSIESTKTPSALLLGKMEHERKKRTRELNWRATAMSALIRFVSGCSMAGKSCSLRSSESLLESVLINSAMSWIAPVKQVA